MANDINIDSLSIEIKSNSDKAVSALDRLSDMLDKLATRVNSVKGLERISNQIDRLSQVAARANPAGLEKLASAAERVSKITMPNFTKTANSLSKLTASINSIGGISDMSAFQTKISEVVSAVKPLETLGKNTLSPFIASLRAIPTITSAIDVGTLDRFRAIMQEIAVAITPLAEKAEKSSRGLEALNGIMQKTVSENGNLASSNAASQKSFTSLIQKITSFKAKLTAAFFLVKRLANIGGQLLSESNAYVENLNLFTVAMGDATDSALDYANAVHDALGIDQSEWIRNMGVFKSIETGFGTITEKANLMAKNLTQIGYDISSFYNISIEDSMQKVQSGISGELEPLRRLGFALDAATLQQIAYDHGIRQNINTMTQAQKSQLRYIAIMQQSTNVMGDMSRTINTPANAMRVLGQQVTQMQRALGNMISVFAVKLLPYIQAAVRLLTDFANYLANMWGFELPEIDYSGMEQGITGLSEDAEDATDSVKETAKAVQRLAGFDEINVLKSADEDAKNIADTLGNQFDLGIELPEYDFLQGASAASDEIYERWKKKLKELLEWWKKHKKIIGEIAKILATMWAINKISGFVNAVSNALSALGPVSDDAKELAKRLAKIKSIIGTVIGAAISAFGTYNWAKNYAQGFRSIGDNALYAVEAVGGLAMAFAYGGWKGVVFTAIIDGLALVKGACDGAKASADKALDSLIAAEWYTGGKKLTDVADELVNYFDTVTKSEKEFLDQSGKLDAMLPTMETLSQDIANLISSLDFEDLDLGKIDELKKKFKELADQTSNYVKESTNMLTAYISANAGILEQQGISAGAMVTYLKDAEGNTLNKIEDIQSKADEILNKGTAMTEQDQAKLQALYEQLTAITGITADGTAEEIAEVSKSVKELSTIKINPENIDTAYAKVTEIATKYGEAYNTIVQAKNKALAQLEIYDWSSPEEKQAAQNAINTIYQGKLEQLRSVSTTVQTIGGQISDVWKSVNEDINTGTVGEWSWLDALPFGYGDDYANMKDKEAIQKAKADLKKEYGSFYTDTQKFIEEQFNMNAGGYTYQDMFRNGQLIEGVTLPDISAPLNIREDYYSRTLKDKILAYDYSSAGLDIDTFKKNIRNVDIELLREFGEVWVTFKNLDEETQKRLADSGLGLYSTLQEYVDKIENADLGEAALYLTNDISQGNKSLEEALEDVRITFGTAEQTTTGQIRHYGAAVTTEANKITYPNVGTKLGTMFTGADSKITTGFTTLKNTVGKQVPILGGAFRMAENIMNMTFSTTPLTNYGNAFEGMTDKILAALEKLKGAAQLGLNAGLAAAGIQIPITVSTAKGYATGGMPSSGDFFFANENGKAEFISTVGSRPAVANQDQMRAEMREGVKEGVIEALSGRSDGNGDIYVFLDGDQIAYSVEKRNSRLTKRTGGR